MYGRSPRYGPSTGRQGQPPPPPHYFHPNEALQDLNVLLQSVNSVPTAQPHNLNFFPQNPNVPFRNPSFHSQQSFTPTLQHHTSPQSRYELLDKINPAVAKARSDIIAAGESVSTWQVSQSALLALQVDSWESLGFRMQEVPGLYQLILMEGKVNSFIHCFVAVQRITSLYELEMAICKNESVLKFEDLELGPLLRHPLILHYFPICSDATEVFKITCEAIITSLCEFIDTCETKTIRVEDFLEFLANKLSVKKREPLGVRVQSFGIYISAINEARKSEDQRLKKFTELVKSKSRNKRRRTRPIFALQKQVLDTRFSAIAQRVKSFSSHKNSHGKHLRFVSSSSEDESFDYMSDSGKSDTGKTLDVSSQNNRNLERVSTCPYPSAIEEISRLGLKGEVQGQHSPVSIHPSNKHHGSSSKKRKSTNLSCNKSGPVKLRKKNNFGPDNVLTVNCNNSTEVNDMSKNDYNMPDDGCRMFISTWKDECINNTVDEVLTRMLQSFETKPQRRKNIKHMFLSYPFIGLLNVAVSSIKLGMWDSIYDTLQTLSHNISEPIDAFDKKYSECECIEVEPSAKDSTVTQRISAQLDSITAEDIVNKLENYVEIEFRRSNITFLRHRIIFLKKLCKCEVWLAEQFSVREFNSIGYGDFFMFLEKYVSLLPKELYEIFATSECERYPLEVSLFQHHVIFLVAQALNNLWENEKITKHMISALFRRQYPFISFRVSEDGSLEKFLDVVEKQKDNVVSKSVIFSATLLERFHPCVLIEHDEINYLGSPSAKVFESFSVKNAIDVLVKAPMLMDLNLWSHWDLLFAPSLGPLVPWLLNDVNTEDLLCLVTNDGKVLRLDHKATTDSFFEAALKGSPFQTAVELLSLFSLFGGEKHVSLSLIKSHARHAFEVILKNSCEELNGRYNVARAGKLLGGINVVDEITASNMNITISKSFNKVDSSMPILSRFVLDCISYIPSEFRGFAADVLLYGCQSVMKNAASVILHECCQPEQRLMLHEVGLCLGVVEWIDDHRVFSSADTPTSFANEAQHSNATSSVVVGESLCSGHLPALEKNSVSPIEELHDEKYMESPKTHNNLVHMTEVADNAKADACTEFLFECEGYKDAALVVESIRRDEFGLDQNIPNSEGSMLMKQHARLGRALHCLSQELYSQDSHFLLELIQNADDNVYPENVKPTLTFILQESAIIVLNNEKGFSSQNIRALCDVGNSTKKGSDSGYIGHKGIGFKSVFRITDAPQIHSNGFHIKFDISEGQIGFVLPTVVPPCNIDLYSRLVSDEADQLDSNSWKTCIVLPFRSKLSDGTVINSIVRMFSDLHPSLLLFLHRLQCVKLRNFLNDSLIVMRKEVLGDGIIKVSHGKEKMTWLVVSQKLRTEALRRDVQSTEISIAFTLQEADDGNYSPHLEQQPVFAFLPLRAYGLKFIIQGDFILPSSREEVDGDSPWNQWLLSEFPSLFISAEKSFCDLSCFKEYPGKAVTAFMSFVPLMGEVHGFFSSLPRLIISKLRVSNCLLLEGKNDEWIPPCKVITGWDEQAFVLLPRDLLQEHLGLGFLHKNISLSDQLAKALGIEEYGPKILVQFISALCLKENCLKSLGLGWLLSWLNTLYIMLFPASSQTTYNLGKVDLVSTLQKVPFIPLSDGTYSSLARGTIWLHSDPSCTRMDGKYGLEAFPSLNAKLRIVCPTLLSSSVVDNSFKDIAIVDNGMRMLYRIGVQQLSAHEIIKVHILPALSDEKHLMKDKSLMTEYICFIMMHLLSGCQECQIEREIIISELQSKALILTNYGFKRPVEVSLHFSKDYGNPININKLLNVTDMKWHEIDSSYLKHQVSTPFSFGLTEWRNFFLELGVTDFVRVVQVEKKIVDAYDPIIKTESCDWNMISQGLVVKDWQSHELVDLLGILSASCNRESCKHLLEVFDLLWDDCFSDKVAGFCDSNSGCGSKSFKSSFMRSICDVQWVVSSIDDNLYYPKDLFHDCDKVRSILGALAPVAVPKVRSAKLVNDIGFKTEVTIDDMLNILKVWRTKIPFKASISQMSAFYSCLWSEATESKLKIAKEFRSGPCIFVPYVTDFKNEDTVSGIFLSPEEVYWHDSSGSVDKMMAPQPWRISTSFTNQPLIKTLSYVYPGLHNFFVHECGVQENPPLRNYLHILQQLSMVSIPSQSANSVFQVFLKWTDGLESGLLSSDDITYLKESLMNSEFKILPTVQDKWVSLHYSFGFVCWSDDNKLTKEFKNVDNIDFLYFRDFNDDKDDMFQRKLLPIMKALGIPVLSEMVTREAIYYGLGDSSFKVSLVNWALPYAQRYLYCELPDKYAQLKQTGFDVLNRLQVITVDKLFYKSVIKSRGIASGRRVECSCILQDNILYSTKESDAHALFMELSRLLFAGTSELRLANFLHMITIMAESGSTSEQIEFFILMTQKVTKLPEEESVWSLSVSTSLMDNDNSPETSPVCTPVNAQPTHKGKRKEGTNSSRPPADWKTAPGFGYAHALGFKTQAFSQPHSFSNNIGPEGISVQTEILDPTTAPGFGYAHALGFKTQAFSQPHSFSNNIGSEGISVHTEILDPITGYKEWTVEDNLATALDMADPENSKDLCSPYSHWRNPSNLNQDIVKPASDSRPFFSRGRLQTGTPNQTQALLTGRKGEWVAFDFFTRTIGDKVVKWVNEVNETGLPYDIVIEDRENNIEYIEVKSTRSRKKDWFDISLNEWQFAVEKGESFSIAHVVLLDQNNARVSVFKNPVKLCKERQLQLALLLPSQEDEFSAVS